MERFTVTFFGVRGSAPSFKKNAKYGVNTSCTLVMADDTAIVLDCGSGAQPLGEMLCSKEPLRYVNVLLSHMHLDHIMGIPCFEPFNREDLIVNVYSEMRMGRTVKQQLDLLMRPPLWPVSTDVFPARPNFCTFLKNESFTVPGGIRVDTMPSNHPDDSTIFRITYKDKSVVYALDFEHSDEASARLIEFAKNCDLLIYDAAYPFDMYEEHRGWGHSTWEIGKTIGKWCKAKRTALSHFSYNLTDFQLDTEEARLELIGSKACFAAREGMTIEL